MENTFFKLFLETAINIDKDRDVSILSIEKYKGKFMGRADDFDMVIHIANTKKHIKTSRYYFSRSFMNINIQN